MSIPALLLTCESEWLAPIRMPAALHHAGFDVSRLAPAGSLAGRSRHVTQSRLLPDNATAQEWLFALVAAVDSVAPTILLPGDEMSLRLMQALVCDPPAGPQPQALKDLSALIVRSLGAPQFYQASVDKALLQPLMQAAGVRVPEFRLVRTPEQAETAARELGPRVVVKPSDGTGGRHVIDCATPEAAAAAFRLLLDQAGRTPAPGAAPSVLIQRRIDGLMVPRSSVAYEGRELAGFARERLQHCAASRSRRSISRRIFADDDAVSAGILARRGESRAAPLSERYSVGRSGALP